MQTFKSKVGYGLLVPVLILLIGIPVIRIINGANLTEILSLTGIMVPLIAFTLHIFFHTTYKIKDNKELLIKSSFLYHEVVDISKIQSIYSTRNPISSPAASLDRIELKYGNQNSVIISPKDKMKFVDELFKINPNIQHDLK